MDAIPVVKGEQLNALQVAAEKYVRRHVPDEDDARLILEALGIVA